MVDYSTLRSAFAELSPKDPRLFSAPGRVNLIGEHTDYNDGFVLPFAANLRTYVAAAPRDDEQVRVYSLNLNEKGTFPLLSTTRDLRTETRNWLKYVQGVTWTLMKAGLIFGGADLAIASEVPLGAGLSSSAALEISVGFALAKINDFDLELIDLARAAQEAEHVFVGTSSGLMDQLTATLAQENHAMFIDCRSLHVTQIPFLIPDVVVAICDTRVKHALVSSAYNKRRRECELAVTLLREMKPEIRALRDLSCGDITMIDVLPDPVRRRARHVVTENERTWRSAEALKVRDVHTLGRLMIQSHKSLRDDFEVSCRELDIMFELANNQAEVLGARMMGGGFGGCTINLVRRESLTLFKDRMISGYKQATGIDAIISIVEADTGVIEHIAL